MLACGGCRVSLSCLTGRWEHLSFAASLSLKWYMCLEKKILWLTHFQGILIWLLLLSVLMMSRGQPVCCNRYVLRSIGPLVTSGMLSWKRHALETAGFLCVMVWYVVHCMVKKWHSWYLMTVTYVLPCLRCMMTALWPATWGSIACCGH